MDPLSKLKSARLDGALPDRICDTILQRFDLAVSGIDRIERASQMSFPAAYVEPSAVISPAAQYGYGVLFARTMPVLSDGRFGVVVQISAPLLAYGLKGTIHAVLAHEFLHYLEMMRRLHKGEMLSDEISGNIFEGAYLDSTRTLEPAAVFEDRTLVNHIKKRFESRFREPRLEKKVVDLWINRGLPKTTVTLDTNQVNLSAKSLSKVRLRDDTAARLERMYQRSQKIRAKIRIY